MYGRAYYDRIHDQHSLAAWHVAHIINCWSKRKVNPSQLLGKNKSGSKYDTLEEYKQNVRL